MNADGQKGDVNDQFFFTGDSCSAQSKTFLLHGAIIGNSRKLWSLIELNRHFHKGCFVGCPGNKFCFVLFCFVVFSHVERSRFDN